MVALVNGSLGDLAGVTAGVLTGLRLLPYD
jgi:hypothetical protein